MKKRLLAIGVVAACSLSALAHATSLAVVDVHEVMHHSAQVDQLNKRLKDRFTPKHDAIAKEQAALKPRLTQFHKNSSVMSDADKKKQKADILKQERTLSQQQMAFSKQVIEAQQQAMKHLVAQLKSIVGRVAKSKHIDIVLPRGGAVYYKDAIDLTEAIKAEFK